MNLLTLPSRVFRRFSDQRCSQTAAALSFATLLGLAPMIAIAAAIISHLPMADSLVPLVQKFLLSYFLPEKAGGLVVRYTGQFALKASRLTWLGGLGLLLTALVQMATIERSFNLIWGVREGRPFVRRISIHLLGLVFGPVLFGVGIALATYLLTASIGLVDQWQGATATVFRVLSFALTAGLLFLLYWKLPNRRSGQGPALAGGVCAAVVFAFMQWAFAYFISGVPTYRVMYGAFAAMPIFMMWLYLSWSVVLLGAAVTAELEGGKRPKRG